jgi:hypothetical protein
MTRTNLEGASHPCLLVSSSVPSVGSSACMNGTTKGSATATPTAACSPKVRSRVPLGRRIVAAATATRRGTPPDTLTRVPSARAAVPHSSRRARMARIAAATAKPRSASLWPPATPWNTTTGFHPISTAAKAARSGTARRAAARASRIVARLAAAATTLNASTIDAGDSTMAVTPAATAVNAGP